MCSLPESVHEDHDALVQKICGLCRRISNLSSLKPSDEVNAIFTELVHTCIPPSSIDVSTLSDEVQAMRRELITLCGTAEGLMELHYSSLIGEQHGSPLSHLDLFPYHSNYIKLAQLEADILLQTCPRLLTTRSRIAFIGSGPMPLTSVMLAKNHMPLATFHNYDIDERANERARRLVGADRNLSKRMVFHTTDILDVTDELATYDVVFLAALVGMDIDKKVEVMEHLGRYMGPDAVLMLRSATGARAFLYPVIEMSDLPDAFEAVSIFHPTGEVINSVLVVKRRGEEQRKQVKDAHSLGVEPARGRLIADVSPAAPVRLPVASNPLEAKPSTTALQILSTGGASLSPVPSSRKEVSAA